METGRGYAGPELPDVAVIKDAYPVFRLEVPGFLGELDPHQHVAVACSHVARRFLNLSKVGLGKTVETIGLIAYQRSLGIPTRWVIVSESSQLYQWADAFRRFLGLEATVVREERSRREATYAGVRDSGREFVLLMTYGVLRRDFDHIRPIPRRSMAYDEAVVLSNPNDTAAKASVLNQDAEYVVLMSAEPVTRGDPLQLFHLFRCMGAPLGDLSEADFDRMFCVRKEKKVRVRGRFGPYLKVLNPVVGMQNAELIRSLMAPHAIRHGDSVLPGGAFRVNRQVRAVTMTPEQEGLYRHLRAGTLERLRGGEMTAVERLQAADALIQLLVAPWVLDGAAGEESPKADAVLAMLAGELAGEQAVVFCRHLRSADLISRRLTAEGVANGVYSGESDAGERHALVGRFAAGELRVLVTTHAGHRGVDGFQCCRNLVVVDTLHQPSTVIQMMGRLARRGQRSRVINVFFLLADGTVEELVMQRLHDRQTVADRLYSEDRAVLFDRSVEELVLELL